MTKEDKQGVIILCVLSIIIIIITLIIINIIRVNNITYEYFKNGKIGKSNQCYIDEEKDCLCLIDGNFLEVDGYYLVN